MDKLNQRKNLPGHLYFFWDPGNELVSHIKVLTAHNRLLTETYLYPLLWRLTLHPVEVQLEVLYLAESRLSGHQLMNPLLHYITSQLEMVLLLSNEGIIHCAEIEPFVSAHLKEDVKIKNDQGLCHR